MNRPSIVTAAPRGRYAASLATFLAAMLAAGSSLPARAGAGSDASAASLFGSPTGLTYSKEYPVIGYSRKPLDNRVARLEEKLERGEVKLEYSAPRGYLDSLLAALEISPTSQTLVYSKTSLQTGAVTAATPRALYFNADTYVGWVQGKHEDIEIASMDSKLGQVFYSLPNEPGGGRRFVRKTLECLACHDTYELSGGGVPRFLLMSTYVDIHGHQLTHEGQIISTQQTPLKYRWGGWYVTGQSGKQVHLGNIQVTSVYQLEHLDKVRRGDIDTLEGLFDTRPYLTDKSDIVALLVLQHQVDVQNLITRVDFEVREALAKAGEDAHLSDKTRQRLDGYMDSLVKTMLFVGATRFTSPIRGDSGFTRWFQSQPAPRDPLGRSLRELDLETRLFKYPLTYLVYSPAFDHLPPYAKRYIYGQLATVLTGRDYGEIDPDITDAQRKAVLEILTATKPDFARFLKGRGHG
jgi:hypothetical protein